MEVKRKVYVDKVRDRLEGCVTYWVNGSDEVCCLADDKLTAHEKRDLCRIIYHDIYHSDIPGDDFTKVKETILENITSGKFLKEINDKAMECRRPLLIC